MTFTNSSVNIKQFKLVKFINENSSDEHVISKISIVLRRDKIEAPYYMLSKIRLSSCIDMEDNGVIHAMDILNHHRMYNLTEDKYSEIKSLICDLSDKSNQIKISKKDKQLKVVLMSKNINEFTDLFKDCGKLFDKIDNLISD